MEKEILANLHNPGQLEKLYRADKSGFRRAFKDLYPDLKDNKLVDFWNERLNFTDKEFSPGARRELVFILIASLLAGVVAKLAAIFSIDEEFFYSRNIGFILFPFLAAYFAWKNKLSAGKIAFISGLTLVGLIFINTLPNVQKSDTLFLSCIHLVLVLWSVLGIAYVGEIKRNDERRLNFLRFNGDLAVMTALILIACGILTGITIGLFSLIGLDIKNFYFEYIVVCSLPAVPMVATFLTQNNPQLVGKISPLIAKIFSPLVLLMLVIYLAAMVYARKDPYNNREFLLIFNALLIGVMALIFFSVTGRSGEAKSRLEIWVLFLLSVVTVLVNGIAISAIVFRIAEWGITPNRAAVLGSNTLILINLLLVTVQLFRVLSGKADIKSVGRSISSYLPVYCLWVAIVTFIFPFLFGFR
jgi:hypothetical protein